MHQWLAVSMRSLVSAPRDSELTELVESIDIADSYRITNSSETRILPVGTCTPLDSQPCRLLQCNGDFSPTIRVSCAQLTIFLLQTAAS